jgi:RNA recognition motif-containing protein
MADASPLKYEDDMDEGAQYSRRDRSPSRERDRSRSPRHERRSSRPRGRPEGDKPLDVPTFSVYVGNLPDDTNERELREIFEEYGDVVSVAIPKDPRGGIKPFGFVHFKEPESQSKAIADHERIKLAGRFLRIERSQAKSVLYVDEVPSHVRRKDLENICKEYAPDGYEETLIMSGFAFVTYRSDPEAKVAIEKLRKVDLDGQPMKIEFSAKRSISSRPPENHSIHTLYVRNIPLRFTEEDLMRVFEEAGEVRRVSINSAQTKGGVTFLFFTMNQPKQKKSRILALSNLNILPMLAVLLRNSKKRLS